MLGKRQLAAVLATSWFVALSVPAPAFACFDPNEGAIRNYVPSPNSKGLKQIVDLIDFHPIAGNAISHPTQVTEPGSCDPDCDFFGFGTYRSTFALAGCPASNGSNWQVYVDGQRFMVYFCAVVGTVVGTAQNQAFTTRYTSCAPSDTLKWVFSLNGTQKACYTNSFTSTDWMGGGGEALGDISSNNLPVDIFYQDSYYLDRPESSGLGPGRSAAT